MGKNNVSSYPSTTSRQAYETKDKNRVTGGGIQRSTYSDTPGMFGDRFTHTHTHTYASMSTHTHTAESNKWCDIDSETLRQGEK